MCCSISFEAATTLEDSNFWRTVNGTWLLRLRRASSSCLAVAYSALFVCCSFNCLYFFFYSPALSAQPIVNWLRRAVRVLPCCAFRRQSILSCNGVQISYVYICFAILYYHLCFILFWFFKNIVCFNKLEMITFRECDWMCFIRKWKKTTLNMPGVV